MKAKIIIIFGVTFVWILAFCLCKGAAWADRKIEKFWGKKHD